MLFAALALTYSRYSYIQMAVIIGLPPMFLLAGKRGCLLEGTNKSSKEREKRDPSFCFPLENPIFLLVDRSKTIFFFLGDFFR